MDTKKLSSFLQVCKDKSLRKAAESKYITPQGLSRIIKSMEDELQVTLFYRNHDGMELTEYGKIVKKHGENILSIFNSMDNELECLKNTNDGDLGISCAYGVASALSPDFLLEYKKLYPKVCLSIIEKPDLFIEKSVYNGKSLIGFTISPVDNKRFNATLIKTHNLSLLVNKQNKLSQKKTVSISDLRNEKLILVNESFNTYHNIIDRCKDAGFTPNIELKVSEISMVHKFTSLNYGVGITVDYVIDDIKYDNVISIPFEDENIKWQIYLITKKGTYLPHIANDFINFIKNTAINF